MRKFPLILALVMAVGMHPAMAQTATDTQEVAPVAAVEGTGGTLDETEGPKERIRVPEQGQITYQRLFQMTSNDGEKLDAFVLRIAPKLRAFSDATGFEACGVLASDGKRFGVVIGTNEAHIACANFGSKVPAGMASVHLTIHSHGGLEKFYPNNNDIVMMGQHMAGRYLRLNAIHGQDLNMFSDDDYRSGPGYLAGADRVLYQGGTAQTVRVVASTGAVAAR